MCRRYRNSGGRRFRIRRCRRLKEWHINSVALKPFHTPAPTYTDPRKFPDMSALSIASYGSIAGTTYKAGKAGAQATAQSERTRPWLLANRFPAISQASDRYLDFRVVDAFTKRLTIASRKTWPGGHSGEGAGHWPRYSFDVAPSLRTHRSLRKGS